jgi:hypothetical protein
VKSSEELRQAAGLMRERAEAAGVQPWGPNDALTWNPHSESGATYVRHEVRGVHKGADWPFIAEANATQYAEHIASWHPAAALSVAVLLEVEAAFCETECVPPTPHVLAVARAYLGTAS